MRRKQSRKSPVKKRRSSPQKKSIFRGDFRLGRLLVFVVLAALLLVSLGAVSYVIFFRVVVAAELYDSETNIIFEEPEIPAHETPAGPPTKREELSRVALIIDDMGYHYEIGKALLALDLNLTFSFLPHAPFSGELEEEAYQQGRTVMLHLPLEPRDLKWDPGPGSLYLNQGFDEHRKQLDADLQLIPHATGVNNHMGSRYTESETAMDELARLLAERELFFVDSVTTSDSQAMVAARKIGLASSRRDVFLDNVQQVQAICSQVSKLVELAQHRGKAIGIAHPYQETLDALTGCGNEILKEVSLVGVETLLR